MTHVPSYLRAASLLLASVLVVLAAVPVLDLGAGIVA